MTSTFYSRGIGDPIIHIDDVETYIKENPDSTFVDIVNGMGFPNTWNVQIKVKNKLFTLKKQKRIVGYVGTSKRSHWRSA